MAHLYKISEWQGGSGKWYCNDVTDLAGVSGKWWVPARMLGIPLTDYILLLKDQFNATIVEYYEPTDILIFHWEKQTDCHKYVLWINAQARKINYMI